MWAFQPIRCQLRLTDEESKKPNVYTRASISHCVYTGASIPHHVYTGAYSLSSMEQPPLPLTGQPSISLSLPRPLSFPIIPSHVPLPCTSPISPFPFPQIQLGGLRSAVSSPAGCWAEPLPKLNWVHFKWKIWHLVRMRIILVTFIKNYSDFPLSRSLAKHSPKNFLEHLYSVDAPEWIRLSSLCLWTYTLVFGFNYE